MGYDHPSLTILRLSATLLLGSSMSDKFRITVLSHLHTSISREGSLRNKQKLILV